MSVPISIRDRIFEKCGLLFFQNTCLLKFCYITNNIDPSEVGEYVTRTDVKNRTHGSLVVVWTVSTPRVIINNLLDFVSSLMN